MEFNTKQSLLYVPSGLGSDFIDKHTGKTITSSDVFYDKIAFVEDTSQIFVHGLSFGTTPEELEKIKELTYAYTNTKVNTLSDAFNTFKTSIIGQISSLAQSVETNKELSYSYTSTNINSLKTELEGTISLTSGIANAALEVANNNTIRVADLTTKVDGYDNRITEIETKYNDIKNWNKWKEYSKNPIIPDDITNDSSNENNKPTIDEEIIGSMDSNGIYNLWEVFKI